MNKTVLFLVSPIKHITFYKVKKSKYLRHRFLFVSLASLPMLEPALKDLQPRLLLDQDQVALHVLIAMHLAQETAIVVQVFYIFLNLAFLPI